MKSEHRRAVVSVLLALQGALILVGAILKSVGGAVFVPFDYFVGVDATIAGIVLGAAFVLAFRTPNRQWVNLAILYESLTILAGLFKFGTSTAVQLTPMAMIVSAVFLVGFLVCYPRGGVAAEVSPA